MRILIAGIDGYIGWPLAVYLVACGHIVAGVDNFARRRWVEEIGGCSAIPIADMDGRRKALAQGFGQHIHFELGDLRDYGFARSTLSQFEPDAVVHLGECASAPYSMIDVEHATFVQTNNIVSTLNLIYAIREKSIGTHLIKIGSMGEYGTPNIDIPEGFFEVKFRERQDRLPFPRQANSWYHLSKVHGSNNLMFACRSWGLRATDIMQGTVFGTRTPEIVIDNSLRTRLDFDHAFGTVINRFCCQAVIGNPLTIYGTGKQTRSFLTLSESVKCLGLLIENPADRGEYRVVNQFSYIRNIVELASSVKRVCESLGIKVEFEHLDNPRAEVDSHYYNPENVTLQRLGHAPQESIDGELLSMIIDLIPYRDLIQANRSLLTPRISWSG
jgi:UDP-sulfoquinovose synthase